jgi:AraC-like DNA-binding protein
MSVHDAFSDILKLADAQSVASGGFTAGGSWAIRFPPFDKLKFSAMVRGNCWLIIDGGREPVRAEAGDVFLLSGQRSFTLASDPAVLPIEAASVFSPHESKIAALGGGEDCLQIGGFVRLDPVSGGFLTEVLPLFIHVHAGSPQAGILQWLLGELVREQSAGLPGASLVCSQLAQLIFVHILRAYLKDSRGASVGWLRALGDKRLAPAMQLMHADPGRAWQLGELAKASAMSRTTFALHFKTAAGVAPLTYLTEWRMRLAQKTLREEKTSIAELAGSLGYTSESAFNHAFKRITGTAPQRYRARMQSAAGAREPPPETSPQPGSL